MERKTLSKKQKILVTVASLAVILAAAATGIALVMNGTTEAEDSLPVATDIKEEKDSTVTITVKGNGVEAAITPTKIKITESKDKSIVVEEVVAGKICKIDQLAKGDYKLEVTALPVHADGSTYKVPESAHEFTVKGDGEAVEIEITLEKLSAADMTKEQLEAAAATLEQSWSPLAAAAAQTAPSVPGSSSSVQPNNTPGGSASGNTPPSGGSNGGSSAPSDPNAGKTWSEAITHQEWVVTSAAWSEQVPVYGSSERSICNTCGADITGNTTAHGKAHVLAGEGGGYHSELVTVITGYNTVNHPEEGYYKTVVDRPAGWY